MPLHRRPKKSRCICRYIRFLLLWSNVFHIHVRASSALFVATPWCSSKLMRRIAASRHQHRNRSRSLWIRQEQTSTTAVVQHSLQKKRGMSARQLLSKNNDNGDEVDSLFRAIYETTKFLSTPLPPQLSGLPVGFPLALLSMFAFISIPKGLATIAFFLLYFFLGHRIILDEDDDDSNDDHGEKTKIAFFALLASILSAVLLSPGGGSSSTTTINIIAVGQSSISGPLVIGIIFVLLGIVALIIFPNLPVVVQQQQQDAENNEADADGQLLDMWDAEFQEQNRDKDRKDTE